jgi:hypothetical protein
VRSQCLRPVHLKISPFLVSSPACVPTTCRRPETATTHRGWAGAQSAHRAAGVHRRLIKDRCVTFRAGYSESINPKGILRSITAVRTFSAIWKFSRPFRADRGNTNITTADQDGLPVRHAVDEALCLRPGIPVYWKWTIIHLRGGCANEVQCR